MAAPSMSLRPGGHVCGVAASHDVSGELAGAWVRSGLEAGERVLWVGPPGPVTGWLRAHGVDWREAQQRGQFVLGRAEEILRLESTADIPDRLATVVGIVERAVADGYAGLRMGAEAAVALAQMPDVGTQFAFERAWEELTSTQPMSFLCVYDPGVYAADVARAVTAHPRGLADGLVFAAAEDDRLRLAGEVDISNVEMIGGFVDAVAGERDVLVDLEGLSFIDVSGASRLVTLSRALGPTRRLRVASAPRALRTILDLSGWTSELDLLGEAG